MQTTNQEATMQWQDYATARDYAGWCYDPARETPEAGRVRSNLRTARMMAGYRGDPSTYVDWVPSELSWDGDVEYDGPLFDAHLYVGDTLAESLGCIAVPNTRDPYCRVIEAELFGQLEARREAMAVRSVN